MVQGMTAVETAKARLAQGRAEILERHRAGVGGQEVVRAISALTDGIVAELFGSICAEAGAAEPPLALVATGGYGRRELSPRSDIDLLALLPDDRSAHRLQADQIAEKFHRALWDAGLEAGYAGAESTSWTGVLAPAGTSRAIVERLNAELRKAVQAPEVRARLTADGAEPVSSSPEAFAAYIKAELAKWGKVVKASGAKAN